MKLMGAFLKLIRWPNLVFIAVTQLLFYYCIYLPLYGVSDNRELVWLVAASLFIAAAGYIINDYFDLNIDQINKPQKNVFVKNIPRRWAILWHFILSLSGIVATVLAVGLHKWYLIAANLFCTVLLWFYSTSFKKRPLIGNIIISLLTAWTILILFFAYTDPKNAVMSSSPLTIKLFRISFLYAGFAFIISLIREAIKDLEDMDGDARYGCKTLPIIAGIRATKIYITIWTIVLIASLIVLQLYILQFRWWFAVLYSLLLVISPLFHVLLRLYRAKTTGDFAFLSAETKFIMLTGILSMIFFRIYF